MTSISESILEKNADIGGKSIVYIGYPIHDNVGDILIHLGAIELMSRLGIKVTAEFSMDDIGRANSQKEEFVLKGRMKLLDRAVLGADAILFQGGGNLGDVWPNDQWMREAIIRRYPKTPIIFMPQSAHFESPQKLDAAKRALSRHSNLKIFCRDTKTYEMFSSDARVELSADTAHLLWDDEYIVASRNKSPEAGTTLYQTRGDKESKTPDEVMAYDWSSMMSATDKFLCRTMPLFKRASLPGIMNFEKDSWLQVERRWLERFAAHFASFQTIRTNRLHGMILASLLAREVEYKDTATGKTTGYANLWLADSPRVARIS